MDQRSWENELESARMPLIFDNQLVSGSGSAQFSEPSVSICSPFSLHSLGCVESYYCIAVNYDGLESIPPGMDTLRPAPAV